MVIYDGVGGGGDSGEVLYIRWWVVVVSIYDGDGDSDNNSDEG